jgi:CMP-N-acetylneuraminic acid synthetase
MINKSKVIAIIQARSGSKGIPNKNIYLLNGYPLITYTLYAASVSKYIDEVLVSTELMKCQKTLLHLLIH